MPQDVPCQFLDVLGQGVAAAPQDGQGPGGRDQVDRSSGGGPIGDVAGQVGQVVGGRVAGRVTEGDGVFGDQPVDIDLGGVGLEGLQLGQAQDGGDGRGVDQAAGDDGHLFGEVGVVDHDLHEEPVDLGFGQGVGSVGFDGVLGGQDQERFGDPVGGFADGHLVFLHDLQEGG